MKKLLSIAGVLLVLFSGCTTIELNEEEAFDVKRTISPEYIESAGYDVQKVAIPTTDSLLLNGWYIHRKEASSTVLYCGGNGFVMVTAFSVISAFMNRNVNVLVYDYRGYGENPGYPSVAGLRIDGMGAYDFLVKQKRVNPDSLIIYGHSLGSFIAGTIAGARPAAGIILECPITDAADWTGRLVPWFLKPFVRFDIDPVLNENSNVDILSRIDLPLLLLAGTDDQVTPPEMADKLYEVSVSQEKRLVLIPGGGHNDLPQKKEYAEALKHFFESVF